MDEEQFVSAVNRKYRAKGLPSLDRRDLPELLKSGGIGRELTERAAENPMIAGFLRKKQERIQALQRERLCVSCQKRFTPAADAELYLYCDLSAPPPEDYCPDCLKRIIEQLDSRNENPRCCY